MSDIMDEELAVYILPRLDTGMHVHVVETQEETDVVVSTESSDGYRLACMSSAGLRGGRVRLTFLPTSAFRPEPEGGWPQEGPRLQEGPPVSEKPSRPIQDWLDDVDAVSQRPYVSDTYTALPDCISIELEQLTVLLRDGVEVLYYDVGVAEHRDSGAVRSRIQTRQRVHGGDVTAARTEALRRSINTSTGRLVGYLDRDTGCGD